jgi:hypothetical protein
MNLLVARDEAPIGGDHSPPGHLEVGRLEEVPHGARRSGVAGFSGHLAVGHHVSARDRSDHGDDRVVE